jgi:hypothetical protein
VQSQLDFSSLGADLLLSGNDPLAACGILSPGLLPRHGGQHAAMLRPGSGVSGTSSARATRLLAPAPATSTHLSTAASHVPLGSSSLGTRSRRSDMGDSAFVRSSPAAPAVFKSPDDEPLAAPPACHGRQQRQQQRQQQRYKADEQQQQLQGPCRQRAARLSPGGKRSPQMPGSLLAQGMGSALRCGGEARGGLAPLAPSPGRNLLLVQAAPLDSLDSYLAQASAECRG